MGFAFSLALMGVQALMQLSSAAAQAEAAEDQFDAEQKELARQQGEENLIAQEKKSAASRTADQQFASMIVAMEARGGAGSLNERQLAGTIGGNEGINLAMLEGNRRRAVEGLQSDKRASRQRALGTIAEAQGATIGAFTGFLGGVTGAVAKRGAAKAAEEAAKGETA